jgi:hypothetical protein
VLGLSRRMSLRPLSEADEEGMRQACIHRERLSLKVRALLLPHRVLPPMTALSRVGAERIGNSHGLLALPPRERTPATAAGLTDHVWTFRVLLTTTCEPLASEHLQGEIHKKCVPPRHMDRV